MKKIISLILIATMLMCTACAGKNNAGSDTKTDITVSDSSSSAADSSATSSSSSAADSSSADSSAINSASSSSTDAAGSTSADASADASSDPADEDPAEPTDFDLMLESYNWPSETKDITFFDGKFNLADLNVADFLKYMVETYDDSDYTVSFDLDEDFFISTNISEAFAQDSTSSSQHELYTYVEGEMVASLSSLVYRDPQGDDSDTQYLNYSQIVNDKVYELSLLEDSICSEDLSFSLFPSEEKLGRSYSDPEYYQIFMDIYGTPDYIYLNINDGEIKTLYYLRGEHFMEIDSPFTNIYDIKMFDIEDDDSAILQFCPEIENPDNWDSSIIYQRFTHDNVRDLNDDTYNYVLFDYATFANKYLNK